MQGLPAISSIGEYIHHVGALHTWVTTLLADDETRRAFFHSNHRLHTHTLTSSDLHTTLQHVKPALPAFTSQALSALTLSPSSPSTPLPPTTSAPAHLVPLLCPARARLPPDMGTSPGLRERLDTYEKLYLTAILDTLTKHDAKYLPGGEYTKQPHLYSLHIHTSTRSVERVFSDVDRQFKTRGAALGGLLISALIAAREATDIISYFTRYQSYGVCTQLTRHHCAGLTYIVLSFVGHPGGA